METIQAGQTVMAAALSADGKRLPGDGAVNPSRNPPEKAPPNFGIHEV